MDWEKFGYIVGTIGAAALSAFLLSALSLKHPTAANATGNIANATQDVLKDLEK